MMLINPHGIELEVDGPILEFLYERGELDQFQVPPSIFKGTGPEKRVLFMINTNGIGDAIHSLPVLWRRVQDGYDVTVISRAFLRPLFERIGCRFIDELDPQVGMGFMDVNLPLYGEIYSLKQWPFIHDFETRGDVQLSRFAQLARLTKSKLPGKEFDFPTVLGFDRAVNPVGDEIIVAMTSVDTTRAYPHENQVLLGIQDFWPTVRQFTVYPSESNAKTLEEMVSVIGRARVLVTVDTGALAIGLALGTPTVCVFGPTSSEIIVDQYREYVDYLPVSVLRTNQAFRECQMPCNFAFQRGFTVNNRCRDGRSHCMRGVPPSDVLAAVRYHLDQSLHYDPRSLDTRPTDNQ